MIRSILLAGVASVTLAGAAAAADLARPEMPSAAAAPAPVPSLYDWSGAYVGVGGGYQFGSAEGLADGFDYSNDTDGVLLGGFAGANFQYNNVVFGLEGDLYWSDVSDSTVTGLPDTVTTEQDWNGSVRGRVGYAFDRILVYATGGLALADENVTVEGVGSDSKTRVGWTLGAGAEAALTQNISARLEYRYSDYGDETYDVGGVPVTSDLTDNRVTLGVSYKFGW